ncbi:hypothetical protein WLH_00126 [Escherichia coli O25b:H4]|uniref:Uncharacterized protein n=1 Tax=Escherichia coli O25b:H4 TaxID=941280 RepID=A0A192C6H1_ECO25|nr:hypothetical protein WLH_00126 [Escherichia coli O25b:H4]
MMGMVGDYICAWKYYIGYEYISNERAMTPEWS